MGTGSLVGTDPVVGITIRGNPMEGTAVRDTVLVEHSLREGIGILAAVEGHLGIQERPSSLVAVDHRLTEDTEQRVEDTLATTVAQRTAWAIGPW